MANWQFNRPPNWPVSVSEPGLDWRPDPDWGPPPVGWELWRRRRPRLLGLRPLAPRTLAIGSAVAGLVTVMAIQLANEPAPGPGSQLPATLIHQVAARSAFAGRVPLTGQSKLNELPLPTAGR